MTDEEIKARGFMPWAGGREIPSDWDEGPVLFFGGDVREPGLGTTPWVRDLPLDDVEIIGYKTRPTASEHPEGYSPELVEVEWTLGTRVEKIKGSSWTGKVVGFYSTDLTPEGYAVESENEPGSVQIYPRSALRLSELDKSKEVDPLEGPWNDALAVYNSTHVGLGQPRKAGLERLRAELDKLGYAITRKDPNHG